MGRVWGSPPLARLVALNLDDTCTELSQWIGRCGARQTLTEVADSNAFEWSRRWISAAFEASTPGPLEPSQLTIASVCSPSLGPRRIGSRQSENCKGRPGTRKGPGSRLDRIKHARSLNVVEAHDVLGRVHRTNRDALRPKDEHNLGFGALGAPGGGQCVDFGSLLRATLSRGVVGVAQQVVPANCSDETFPAVRGVRRNVDVAPVVRTERLGPEQPRRRPARLVVPRIAGFGLVLRLFLESRRRGTHAHLLLNHPNVLAPPGSLRLEDSRHHTDRQMGATQSGYVVAP